MALRNKKLLLVTLLAAPMMLTVTGCSSSGNGSHTIRVLNLEDYIYLYNPKDGYNEPDLIHQFEKYANEKFGFDDVKVVYDCSDTNESEYNDLLTGRIKYDLVCTSDYMLQKFVREDLVVPLDTSLLTNYNTYASKTIKNRLDEIPVVKEDKTVYLKDYAVGYMWGTLGLLINPNFSLFQNNETISEDKLFEDCQSWDILWNSDYRNAASIKNSMRDTYAVALMHGYDEELSDLRSQYLDGTITAETYNARLSKVFNRVEDKDLELVKEELNSLKSNVFGLEIDSGKQDIITGKIGLNLAWSGDAVYSMDQAEEAKNAQELYYAIPENGSNVWFDGWAMPKNDDRSDITTRIATEFLNFLSDPKIAAKNMDYTGYTSFVGGDSILELVRDWYDIRTDEIYFDVPLKDETVSAPLFAIDEEAKTFIPVDYDDFLVESHKEDKNENIIYYYIPHNLDEEGELIEIPSSYKDLIDNGDYIYIDEEGDYITPPPVEPEEGEEVPEEEEVEGFIYVDSDGEEVIKEAELPKKTYGDLTIVDEEESELEEVDLKYFFEGTLSEYDIEDAIFYSDCYLPFEIESGNISVGRQFFCQYPDEETILRCSVMADYGDRNIAVVKLWEDFKSNPLPVWAIVLFAIEVTGGIGVALYFYLSKRLKKQLRMKRKSLQ